MPRHRREHVPRHRAQRPAETSGRRAGLNAALTSPPHAVLATGITANPVLADAGPADPDVVETTPLPVFLPMVVPLPLPLPQPGDGLPIMQAADSPLTLQPAELPPGLRPHSHSKRRSGGEEAGRSAQPQSVARGLLVTPWFAAAAGFVIAAGLWIISPHADLISTTPAIGKATVGPGSTLTGKGDGRDRANASNSASSSSTSHSAVASHGKHGKPVTVTVLYHGIVWHNGNFFLVISLPESLNGTRWKLEFQLPGDEDIKVLGARWQPSGEDGGTARDQPPDAGHWQNYRHLGGYPSWHPGVDFFAHGLGSQVTPTGCKLNGRDCVFVPLTFSHGSGNTNHNTGTAAK